MAGNIPNSATVPALPARQRRRRARGINPRATPNDAISRRKSATLPEYLEKREVDAIIACAEPGPPRLLILVQWRAGLRIAEALALTKDDLSLDSELPTLRVRRGKGGKARLVPVHPELETALRAVLDYGQLDGYRKMFQCSDRTAHRWLARAVEKTVLRGDLEPGRAITTHKFRHSCARHWLANGIPINYVSRWLGHASIQSTLVYLELLPDPMGSIAHLP